MKLKTIAAVVAFLTFSFVLCFLYYSLTPSAEAQSVSAWRTTAGSVDLGDAGASAFAVKFNAVTIRADSNNAGVVCIGPSTVTCTDGIATAATDGLKLSAGDTVTISGGQWAAGAIYLNNTSVSDWVSYLVLY